MTDPSHTLPGEVTNRGAEVARQGAGCAREILGNEVEVFWFGSWARGRAQPHSDLDIAVSTGQSIPSERMAALRKRVEALPTLYDVDVMDLSAVGARIKEEILLHGVKL